MFSKLFISKYFLYLFLFATYLFKQYVAETQIDESTSSGIGKGLFKLEGKVINQFTADESWIRFARIMVDGGTFIGLLKLDGSFILNGIPSGSYVVEVMHPYFVFDSVRLEINSKGKVRARALDNLQPFHLKNSFNYPLKLRCKGRIQYFQQREQWRISDFLFNPMILMMFLPLLIMFILPKLMNSQDPELQKEMQQSMNLMTPKNSLPEVSEVLTKWLGGNKSSSSSSSLSPSSSSSSSISASSLNKKNIRNKIKK